MPSFVACMVRRLFTDRRAAAGVELAMISPMLALMTFAVVDIGNVLTTRAALGSALQAGSNYAVSRAADVSTEKASNVATSIATLVSNTNATNFANAVVTVNNGPGATATNGAVSTSGANGANALCYCPNTTTFAWGAAVDCGSACSGGGLAGRFVQITVSRTLTPVFSTYGLVANNVVTVRNMVQTE